MRWIFCEPHDFDYADKVEAQQRIAQWWQAFVAKKDELVAMFRRQVADDLPEWMAETLQAIHPELMWEFGPAVNGQGHRLVITPESSRYLRPLAAAILQAAPQLPGWEFYGYRLPESAEMAHATVQARTPGRIDGVMVRPTVGKAHRVDLSFYSPHARKLNDDHSHQAVFVATETLLGEELLDHWIGGIDVEPLPKQGFFAGKKPTNLLPLTRLYETVQSVLEHIQEQLQPGPYYHSVASQQWAVYRKEPEQAADYADRDDLLVGGSVDAVLAEAISSPRFAFHSPRFSRSNERFLYLKLDGEGAEMEDRFQQRGEFEEAINEALIPQNIGCHIGGATGLRYTYIDLALTDVRRALPILRNLLAGKVAERSWILFHDADLCGEWIGIYPETPPPPLAAS